MQNKQIKYWLAGCFSIMAAAILFTSCNKQPIGPTEPDPVAPGTYLPISQFRALYTGTGDVVVPVGTKKIRGVVISNNANEAVGNFRVQDESGAGIYLYTVQGSPVYPLGQILEIDAAGDGILTLYRGDLELKNVPAAKVVELPGTMNITPRVTTAQQVTDSMHKWSSTLVKLNNISVVKGSTNSTGQNYTITDASGSIVSFVRNTAGIILPEGNAVSITGYVSIYEPTGGTPIAQLTIRTAADLVK